MDQQKTATGSKNSFSSASVHGAVAEPENTRLKEALRANLKRRKAAHRPLSPEMLRNRASAAE